MFNYIRPVSKFSLKRLFSSQSPQNVIEQLKERSLIRVSGAEVLEFLQGLITNDMKHIENGPGSMYTMFLNTKGRVLYDAIVYRTHEDNAFLIECDKVGSDILQKHLKMFRVRRKIEVTDLENDYKVSVLFNTQNVNFLNEKKHEITINEGHIVPCDKLNETLPKTSAKFYKDILIFKDPRISSLGSRIISKVNVNVEEQLKEIVEIGQGNINYRWFRYLLGVGEGVNDLPSGNCFPLEANCDYLHGVSFHKGCYIGQELTARTYHTGVIRKRLMPLHFVKCPTQLNIDEAIIHENANLGKFRGIEGNVGLALLRIAKALDFGEIKIGDGIAKVIKPTWWPIEASKDKISVQKS